MSKALDHKITKDEIHQILDIESDRLSNAIVKDNPKMYGYIHLDAKSFDVNVQDCNELIIASVKVEPDIMDDGEVTSWTLSVNDVRKPEFDEFNIKQFNMIFNHYDALERGYIL